jgi:hypothetical protein
MLTGWSNLFFVQEHFQCSAQTISSLIWLDDIIEITKSRGLVGIGEFILEVLD